ncbi:MAG: hypothetical protein AAGK17_11380 [Pseudomonadota bacterium]
MRPILVAITAALCLSACAGDKGRYPSLAVRDIERTSGQFAGTNQAGDVPVAAPVASEADLRSFVMKAREAHLRFDAARSVAQNAVTSGAGAGSESASYADALLALADLSSLRSETALALGELDLLAADAKTQFAPETEILAAQSEVAALLDKQDEAIDRLNQALPQ